jgi:hypothetical protein
VRLLRQALPLGLPNVDYLKKEPLFKPLNERADFQALIRDLEKKNKPSP